MTRTEIIAELESLARQSENTAQATEAGVAVFEGIYKVLLDSERTQYTQDRINEIYAYAIEWPREVRRQRKEAELFKAAVQMLKEAS